MLLEPQRPEECDTTKTAPLQKNSKLEKEKRRKKNTRKKWNCDLLYAVFSVTVFLGFVLFVSVFRGFFATAAVGRQKQKRILDVLWIVEGFKNRTRGMKKNKKNAVRFLYDTISMPTNVRKSISIAKAHKVKLNKLGNAPTDCSQRLSLQCFGFLSTHTQKHTPRGELVQSYSESWWWRWWRCDFSLNVDQSVVIQCN